MPRCIVQELIGVKFGRWTVLSIAEPRIYCGRKFSMLNCICDCGTEKVCSLSNLRGKNTTSCGCYAAEVTSKRVYVHGLRDHKLMKTWGRIIQRCLNPNNHAYEHYGARGICIEWTKFKDFYDWAINNGWEEGLSIERIDVNGNYSPINCKWATVIEQNNNKRSNHLLTFAGETKNVTQWASALSIKAPSLFTWVRKGGTIEGIMKKRGITYGIHHAFGFIG